MAPEVQCALCSHPRARKACMSPDEGRSPDFCPMALAPEVIERASTRYDDADIRALAVQAAHQEAEGYADRHAEPYVKRPHKTRVEETREFARRMGYARVGLAFCAGLAAEARVVSELLSAGGLEVISVACKVGATPKERLGLTAAQKVRPGPGHESMCNPVSQAALLNEAGTELNVVLGLCVGHDALFLQAADAPCTVLAVKDRVTGHNPLAAVYAAGSYFERLKESV